MSAESKFKVGQILRFDREYIKEALYQGDNDFDCHYTEILHVVVRVTGPTVWLDPFLPEASANQVLVTFHETSTAGGAAECVGFVDIEEI